MPKKYSEELKAQRRENAYSTRLRVIRSRMGQLKEESQKQDAAISAAPNPHHISAGKVIVVLLLLAAIVAAVALAGYLPRKKREEAANAAAREEEKTTLPAVTSARVRRAAGDTDVVLPGNLSPLLESSIYARAAGYVRKRYVDIGDHVKEGTLMAEIDAPELDQQVAQARAAVSQAEQQLSQAKAAQVQAESQRDLAKITAERYNNLVTRAAVATAGCRHSSNRITKTSSEALVSARNGQVFRLQRRTSSRHRPISHA